MKTIAVCDVNTRLAEILAAVEHGEEYTITKHGEPIARLLPPSPAEQTSENVAALIAKLNALSDAGQPAEFEFRDAIEAGRD